jgi:hypothetical protein
MAHGAWGIRLKVQGSTSKLKALGLRFEAKKERRMTHGSRSAFQGF